MNNEASTSKQFGFTLIELIIVIALLGILAATALPRFADLSREANIAVLEGMGGAILASANIVHAQAIIKGVHKQAITDIDLDGDGVVDVEIAYGYPSANRNNSISEIMDASFYTDWTWSTSFGDGLFWLTTAKLGGRTGVYVNQTAVLASGCYILYNPATATVSTPVVGYVTTDC
ncbi:MAG: MSHA pilin protein MshA [Oleiphilaceae bacterium]|jgi:MSHA pilin protein MshA